MHGHTYRLVVFIDAPLDPHLGWVADFAEIKVLVENVINIVDHKTLNDIEGLGNPTCELLAVWLWDKLKTVIPALKKIELNETPNSGVIYEGA
jgi:6-pyruvoyltetrahydropterin/6-carboxytetrahydropterin synthase